MSTDPQRLHLVGRTFVGFEQALAVQAAAFEQANPGTTVEMRFLEPQDLYASTVAGAGLAGGGIDITLTLTDWLPEALARGLLVPLDRYLRDAPPLDWPEGWSPSLRGLQRDAAGHTYALPYHDGPMMLIYRRDMFEDPREQEAYRQRHGRPLRPPETWSEYLRIARFFTRPEQGLYGVVAAGLPDAHNNVYDFMIHTWSRGGRMLDEAGLPAFDEPVAAEALCFHLDLFNRHQVVPPEAKGFDSVASGAYYAGGGAAMMVNWCGFATMAEVPEHSRVVGRNGLGLVPRGDGQDGRHTSINVYWALAIAAGSARKDLAYAFLRHVAGPAMDVVTARHGCIAVRRSTWRDPEILRQFPVYAAIEEVHRSIDSPPPIPTWPAITEILNVAIDDALHGRRGVPDALAWATREACKLQ